MSTILTSGKKQELKLFKTRINQFDESLNNYLENFEPQKKWRLREFKNKAGISTLVKKQAKDNFNFKEGVEL